MVCLTSLPVGSSVTIKGDGESIKWEKVHNGKYAELIRTHTLASGEVKRLSEPMGRQGYVRAQDELDFRQGALGWTQE